MFSPSPASSSGSQPVNRLKRARPLDRRSRVAAWRAATVGEMTPGRSATRNLRRWVTGISEAATSQESSQERPVGRSEEHTSELQSRENLVCRLLLEKKKRFANQSIFM